MRWHELLEFREANLAALGQHRLQKHAAAGLGQFQIGATLPVQPLSHIFGDDDLAFDGHFCLGVHSSKARLTRLQTQGQACALTQPPAIMPRKRMIEQRGLFAGTTADIVDNQWRTLLAHLI